MDAALGSLLPPGGRVLIPTNGFFGERMATIAEANGLVAERAAFEWGKPLDLALVEDRLRDEQMDALAVVHHETSTGVLNPLLEVSALARKHGLWLVVDAVSSLGGVESCRAAGNRAAVGEQASLGSDRGQSHPPRMVSGSKHLAPVCP